MKKVSVILPVHNSAEYLTECLDSINKQSYRNFILIIVDDGSTDASPIIIKKFIKGTKTPTRFIQNKNSKGVSAARNQGLKVADTPFVTYVDSDDLLSPFHFFTLIQNMSENTAMSTVGITRKGKSDFLKSSNSVSYDCQTMVAKVLGWQQIQGYVYNKLFRMSLIRHCHIKFCEDLSVCEDLLFVIQYLLAAGNQKSVFNYSKSYYYRVNENSTMMQKNDNDDVKRVKNQLLAYSKILKLIKLGTQDEEVFNTFYEDSLVLLNHAIYIEHKYNNHFLDKKYLELYMDLRTSFFFSFLINFSVPLKTKLVFLCKAVLNLQYS